ILAVGVIIAAVAGASVLYQIEQWTLLRPCNLDTNNSSLKFRPCRWVGFRELLVYLVMRRYSSLLFDGHQAFVDELIHTDRAELTAVTRAFHAAEGTSADSSGETLDPTMPASSCSAKARARSASVANTAEPRPYWVSLAT